MENVAFGGGAERRDGASSTARVDVADVLRGCASYDDLNEVQQAEVRRVWDAGIAESIAGLDLAAEFVAQGRSWVEADEDGNVVYRNVDGDR